MAVEEISLTLPEWSADTATSGHSDAHKAHRDESPAAILARSFVQAARKRDSFAFTKRQRARRIEQFEGSIKAIVSQAAADASALVGDRNVRSEMRGRIYRNIMTLVREIAIDQLAMRERTRRVTRWSLAIAAAGLGATIGALFVAGLLPI
jgi:hypothetical protein